GSSIAPLTIDSEFGWYSSSVTNALFAQWQRPMLEGQEQPLEVRVGFTILRDGSVRDLRVETTSGVPALDRSALRAVTDAAPLPPLPKNWPEPTLAAVYVFRLLPGEE
ncbi:MAG TPA: energy transducer TonB, partial [Candidatus Polarisedimenticolaceae bacterium]|nr:energy transducer TonB [Candidatus Polarisedimenticolaceae bacterium]